MARGTADEWARRVERWKDSGLTAKEFAAESGVKASTLTFWNWKLSAAARATASSEGDSARERKQSAQAREATARKQAAKVSEVVELPIATVTIPVAMVEIILGEVRVRVGAGFDEATLTRVVRAVEAAR